MAFQLTYMYFEGYSKTWISLLKHLLYSYNLCMHWSTCMINANLGLWDDNEFWTGWFLGGVWRAFTIVPLDYRHLRFTDSWEVGPLSRWGHLVVHQPITGSLLICAVFGFSLFHHCWLRSFNVGYNILIRRRFPVHNILMWIVLIKWLMVSTVPHKC